MYSVVLIIIGAIAVWGLFQYKAEMQFRQRAENQYNRAFYEMADNVQNVEVMLTKAMIANSPEQGIANLSEVWRQANLAQANLGQLPISQLELNNVSKFLNQVSDFSNTLVRQNLNQKPITPEQFDSIKKLHDYSIKMNSNINQLQNEMGQGRIKWGELTAKGTPIFRRASKNFTTTQFEALGKEFKEMPSLIYDGPFSDQLGVKDMKGLTGEVVNQSKAQDAAEKFIGADKVQNIQPAGTTKGDIKTYNFQITMKSDTKNKNTAMVRITEKGGHPLLLTSTRNVIKEVTNMNQAKDSAQKFLKSRGFDSMIDTYYLKEDGVATINYAYSQNNITIYPDLIKVKIALDNGEILGFEAKNYFLSHTQRKIDTPKISQSDAKKVINPKLKVTYSGLAIIPTTWKTEVLTYEFKGRVDGRDFIVYVNAETGKEERILLIINTPNGILTM